MELAASDLRIERTQAMLRYERCVEPERELLWWHTELATTLGCSAKKRRRRAGRRRPDTRCTPASKPLRRAGEAVARLAVRVWEQ